VIPGILVAAAILGGILAKYSKSQEEISGHKKQSPVINDKARNLHYFSKGEISEVRLAEIIPEISRD
jgi:hypothetical protein